MKKCIAITCAGRGDIWLVKDKQEADVHPLVQYGDAVISNENDLTAQYNDLDISELVGRLSDPELLQQLNLSLVEVADSGPRDKKKVLDKYAPKILKLVLNAATPILDDPSTICQQVRKDRTQTIRNSKMSNKTAPENKSTKPKQPKQPKQPKHDPSAKITLCKDKEGNQYCKANNPKRAGSKSADRFACYKDGMAVGDALKAGVLSADLDYDSKKGFIKIT